MFDIFWFIIDGEISLTSYFLLTYKNTMILYWTTLLKYLLLLLIYLRWYFYILPSTAGVFVHLDSIFPNSDLMYSFAIMHYNYIYAYTHTHTYIYICPYTILLLLNAGKYHLDIIINILISLLIILSFTSKSICEYFLLPKED